MEEKPVVAIREVNRNRVFLNRRKHKDEETDARRSLTSLQLTPCDVKTIANKLKRKTSISALDLKLLQNALIDDPKNVELVLNTHGALRGLVGELTGHDINKQTASCGCICNLALGDSKTCCTVAKAAGPYLVAALDTLTTQLAVTCAWSLGNIAGSGARACNVITAQGALSALCDVMHQAGDMQEAAVYALTHVAYALKGDLRTEYLHKMVQSLSKTDVNINSCHLLFILSCHNNFSAEIIPEQYLREIVEKLPVTIDNHMDICNNSVISASNIDRQTAGNSATCGSATTRCCELIFLIRVLANLNNSNLFIGLLDYFVTNNVVSNIKKFLETDDLNICWLLGNILNCCGDHVFFHKLVDE